jgi:N-acyl-D-aspartate/D-glutamate deacylase
MEENLFRRGGANSFLITGDSPWRGKTLRQVADELGMDPIDATLEIVRGGDPSVASFVMDMDDVDALAIQPWMMTGSDGSTGHPRKFATYPQAYREFVLGHAVMPLEQFVHRSSGLVADTYSLCDRGYIRERRRADIAVIDLDRYRPVADFENPTELATGVTYLLVNGKLAIDRSRATTELGGEIIDFQNISCNQ